MKKLSKDKRGFSTIMALISGAIGIGFLMVFALIFFQNLANDGITGTSTYADNLTDNYIANFSTGVTNVSNQIPTVFTIGVFVLIIGVLLIAYVFAKRNGLMGGGQLG